MKLTDLPAVGTPLDGGFYAGLINLDGEPLALIVAPKSTELANTRWGEYGQDVPGANSTRDGLANTRAMVEAGSPLGAAIVELEAGGHGDWYLPSRDELEVIYRNLKPGWRENYCSFRDGENAYSLPIGEPYTAKFPAQTTAEAFRTGGEQAFEERWYWASTQCSPHDAWVQDFGDGTQLTAPKGSERRARAVRRFKVTP